MSETDSHIRTKSLSGLTSLGFVGLASKLLGLLGGIVIARLLAPDDYGIFAVIGFLIGTTRLMTDVGLGASIVQNRREPDHARVSSVFYFQNGLVLLSIGILFLALPSLPRIYPAFRPEYTTIVYILAIDFLLCSVKSIPQAVLSRRADFREISRIELSEQLIYWGMAIGLAWGGFGVWALAWAVVARSAVSTLLFFLLIDWRPRREFSLSHIREHLGFGVEYQLARVFDYARESIAPTLISQYFGIVAVGYTSWAITLTRFPQFVMLALHRASLTWFSRIQDDHTALREDILKSVELSCLILFPMMAALIVFTPEVIHYVFSIKWLPAARILQIYSINFALIAASYPLYTATFSLGQTRFLLFKVIGLTLIEFAVTILFREMGFEVIAIAQSVSIVVSLFAYLGQLWVSQGKFVNVFTPILKYTVLSALSSGVVVLLRVWLPGGVLAWIFLCGVFTAIYCVFNWFLNHRVFCQFLRIALIQTRIRIPLRFKELLEATPAAARATPGASPNEKSPR